MEFKDQVRIARESKGLSQAELAIAMEVSGQAVIWWELGVHQPRTPMLRRLEELLDVRFNLTGSKPRAGAEETVFGLGKDVVSLAQKISMLPPRHRNALEALVDIGTAEKGKKLKSFIHVEENIPKKTGFIQSVEEEIKDGGRKSSGTKTTKRPATGKSKEQ